MLIVTPKIDLDGERWFYPYKKPEESKKEFSPDAGYKVGTKEFNLASVGDIDSVDDLLIDNVARFLLKDWEGVGQLVDGTEVALDYTPELGTAMLKQHPELYWLILAEATNIAQGKEQQTQETVKKP